MRLILHPHVHASVDASPLSHVLQTPCSAQELSCLPMLCGRDILPLGTIFEPQDDGNIDITIVCKKHAHPEIIHRLGSEMQTGNIYVQGDTGHFTGENMQGGTITVSGSVAKYCGYNMRGGIIKVGGNAGDYAAACDHRIHHSPSAGGGCIVVGGNTGNRCGDLMLRTMLLVRGNVGDYCGSRMRSGTVMVTGTIGTNCGYAMKRGSLIFSENEKTLLHQGFFLQKGLQEFGILTLICRKFRGIDPVISDNLPTPGIVQRLVGDALVHGRGEIFLIPS